jgi:hypothetical protein
MLASIDSRELSEWLAYERITGPLGQARDDRLLGMVAAVMANTARDPKKRPRPFDTTDFLLWDDVDRPEQTMEEQMELFRALAEASQRAEEHR